MMVLKSIGKCIYCGASGVPLSDEHVIPYSMMGTCVLPKASCAECAEITSKIEMSIARKTYLGLRTKANFPTYHKRNRPKYFDIRVTEKGQAPRIVSIDAEAYPTIYPVLHLPPPTILTGEDKSEGSPEMRLSISGNEKEMNALGALFQEGAEMEIPFNISWGDLCRVLAKIAHSYTVGAVGVDGYTQLLPHLILGEYPYLSELVGGVAAAEWPRIKPIGEGSFVFEDGLEIGVDPDGHIIVYIGIMDGRLPMYSVVAGKVNDWNVFLTNSAHRAREGQVEYAHGMRTRFGFTHEWAYRICGLLRNIAKKYYPDLLPYWPLSEVYSFEVFAIPGEHYLFIFKSSADSVPTGPDGAFTLPASDHPTQSPNMENIKEWLDWINLRFDHDGVYWPFILPVRDSWKNDVKADMQHLSEDDKVLYCSQINAIVEKQWQVAKMARGDSGAPS